MTVNNKVCEKCSLKCDSVRSECKPYVDQETDYFSAKVSDVAAEVQRALPGWIDVVNERRAS